MSRVFANGLKDQSSIPGQVIPETQKMLLDATLLNTQQYKVRIKGKWSNPGSGDFGVIAIEKGVFRSPSTKNTNFYLYGSK